MDDLNARGMHREYGITISLTKLQRDELVALAEELDMKASRLIYEWVRDRLVTQEESYRGVFD